jgi:hypothetical protein
MSTLRLYTLERVSKMCGLAESELTAAIRSNELKAEFIGPMHSYMVSRVELLDYLMARGHWQGLHQVVRPRVVVMDRDGELTSTMRLMMRRDDRCDFSQVTSSEDLIHLSNLIIPSLMAVCLPALMRHFDPVSAAVRMVRQKSHAALILYYRGKFDYMKMQPGARDTAEAMEPDAILPLPGAIQPLVERIYEMTVLRLNEQRL